MSRAPVSQSQDDVQGPARIGPDHVQDRELSPVAGSPRGYRRLDPLATMEASKELARHQVEAGRRLQKDYAMSQMEAGARTSNGERTDGGRHSFDIPDYALDAKDRLKHALAVLTPETLSMTTLFLLPNHNEEAPTLEKIAARVGEHKRAISFGIRTALSLLARHYGG